MELFSFSVCSVPCMHFHFFAGSRFFIISFKNEQCKRVKEIPDLSLCFSTLAVFAVNKLNLFKSERLFGRLFLLAAAAQQATKMPMKKTFFFFLGKAIRKQVDLMYGMHTNIDGFVSIPSEFPTKVYLK